MACDERRIRLAAGMRTGADLVRTRGAWEVLVTDNDAGVLLLVRLRVGKETGIDGRFLGDRVGERGNGGELGQGGEGTGKGGGAGKRVGRRVRVSGSLPPRTLCDVSRV